MADIWGILFYLLVLSFVIIAVSSVATYFLFVKIKRNSDIQNKENKEFIEFMKELKKRYEKKD